MRSLLARCDERRLVVPNQTWAFPISLLVVSLVHNNIYGPSLLSFFLTKFGEKIRLTLRPLVNRILTSSCIAVAQHKLAKFHTELQAT